ncbi:hypothetical protein D1AOALGA4SA_12579 [Olavius algarvensis Delta 1 endosymbiont]|nr:hypothetical protein D1AOALGA4SA_12579 [Olavius algarvensis Delta 1 endosymbiont]
MTKMTKIKVFYHFNQTNTGSLGFYDTTDLELLNMRFKSSK